MSELNYNHLRHFWTIAMEGSLSRAARRLHLTHSTLSVQLKSLEETLGHPLIVRRARGVSLTPFGEHVKGYCDDIFRLGAELEDTTRGGHTVPRPTVRIGVQPSLPRTLMHRALRVLRKGKDAPAIVVESGEVETLAAALVSGRLHVVLADRPPSTSSDAHVYAHLLGETRISFFAAKALAARHSKDFPRSLNGAPLLLPGAGSTLRESLLRWFAEEGIRPRVVGEIDDLPLMKTFAAGGEGIMAVRDPLADEAERLYGLRRIGRVGGVRDQLYALTVAPRVRHADVQRLISECKRTLA